MWLSGFVKCDCEDVYSNYHSILFDKIAFFAHHMLPVAGCRSVIAGTGNTTSTPTPVLEKNDHDRFLPKHAKNADLTPSFQLVKPHLVNTWTESYPDLPERQGDYLATGYPESTEALSGSPPGWVGVIVVAAVVSWDLDLESFKIQWTSVYKLNFEAVFRKMEFAIVV